MKKQIEDLSYLATMEVIRAQARHAVAKRHGKFRYENNRKYKNKRKEVKDFYQPIDKWLFSWYIWRSQLIKKGSKNYVYYYAYCCYFLYNFNSWCILL